MDDNQKSTVLCLGCGKHLSIIGVQKAIVKSKQDQNIVMCETHGCICNEVSGTENGIHETQRAFMKSPPKNRHRK